jgi:hypothetical protein
MPILASLGAGSIGAYRTVRRQGNLDDEPRLILALSNGGTFAYRFSFSEGLSNVTTTYITTASPSSAGSPERIRASDTTNLVAVTGWAGSGGGPRAAAFDTTTTPFTQYNKNSLPIGSSGNALGAEAAADSNDTYVYFTSLTGGGSFPKTSDSYTAISGMNNYDPICFRHNRLYHFDATTSTIRVYPSASTSAIWTSGASPFGSGNNNIQSIKSSARNPPSASSAINTPEIMVWAGPTNYTYIQMPEANNTLSNVATLNYTSSFDAQAVTRDGSIVCIAQSAAPYTIRFYSAPNYDTPIASFNPATGPIRSLDVFKNGRVIAALDTGTLYIYDINGKLLDSEPCGTYGVAVLY